MSAKRIVQIVTVAALQGSAAGVAYAQITVTAVRETPPSRHGGDSVDDAAIWLHPSDPAQSLILVTDKRGGIYVYGLDAVEVQHADTGKYALNIDVRYNFPLAGKYADGTAHTHVALVSTAQRNPPHSILLYKVNPATRKLERLTEAPLDSWEPYGSCFYVSPATRKHHLFVNSKSGVMRQWELKDNGAGGVALAKVREVDVGNQVEGCVADDMHRWLYVGEEAVGVWKYGAEPDAGGTRSLVDKTSGGHLKADVEGVTIYYRGDGGGYLIVSSQGSNSFKLYERTGDNAFVGSFRIVDGAVDGCSDTDGIDVVNVALGPDFPAGLFLAQDGSNTKPSANQNFKLVSWETVSSRFTPPLRTDTRWDPRLVGAEGRAPLPPPPPPPVGAPARDAGAADAAPRGTPDGGAATGPAPPPPPPPPAGPRSDGGAPTPAAAPRADAGSAAAPSSGGRGGSPGAVAPGAGATEDPDADAPARRASGGCALPGRPRAGRAGVVAAGVLVIVGLWLGARPPRRRRRGSVKVPA